MFGGIARSKEHDEGLGARQLWCGLCRCVGSSGSGQEKGVGKLRRIYVSFLWTREIQDREDLELIKVLGTEHPVDLMTKCLIRAAADRCMGYQPQERVAGRAKSGLKVQGGGEQEEEKDKSAHPR